MNTRPAYSKVSLVAGAKPTIDGYEILDELGSGEWARVHRARHLATGSIVACKTLRESVWRDTQVRQRFGREVDVPRGQIHPYILQILEAGESNGWPYFIMPYCQGGNLEQERQRRGGRIPCVDAFHVMKPAMQGIAMLHARNIVHRDIKPQNILLDGRGISLLADFGLAKSILEAGFSGITSNSTKGIGSVAFMPREQMTNFRYVDPRTDVWALAATYYYVVTGVSARPETPYASDFASIVSRRAIPLREHDTTISSFVARVIDRALSDDVEARHANAGAFLRALERALFWRKCWQFIGKGSEV